MLTQPFIHIEEVVLLRPQHSGQCLPVYSAFIFSQLCRGNAVVELVRVRDPGIEIALKVRTKSWASRFSPTKRLVKSRDGLS